jgi:PST family polysaccharide transporter
MSTFKKDLVSGTFYIGIAKYAGIICGLVISAILARLLTPSDFGVVAIASVLMAFFNILSDIGIGVAVIQRKDLSDGDLNHLYSINVYIGFILSLIFFLSSGFISKYYDNEQLLGVCQLLSILIFITCANTVPMNMLYREKQFKYIAFTSLIVQLVSGLVAVIAALSGWGVYALVFSQILSAASLLVLYSLKYRRKFYFKVELAPLKKIFSYSVYNFMGTIFCYFTLNIDKLIVGKSIGATALGYYEKSYRLVFMPIQNITFVITPVLHPLFSEFQNDYEELGRKFMKIVSVVAYISFPLSVYCFFISKELILVFFGDQWYDAIPPFRIMSLAISWLMIDTMVGSIMNAANKTKRGFYTMVLMTSIMILSVIAAIQVWNSIIAVAWGFLLAKTIGTLINYYSLMVAIEHPYSVFLKQILKPLAVGVIMFIFMWILCVVVEIDNVVVSLIYKTFVAFIISAILVKAFSGFNMVKYAYEKVCGLKSKFK